ncbi:MAG: stage II sporulation protein D [Anaeromicrobium sp.]|jgi:stage II sporulation protein D|uniref:stage II sporulation protein D n=1 Tax=Anaeromicrobium sp. TaxID=1929132 RepID=UPI0025D7710B|nr:stage II sporulation protein D [Anaeromicrobium sp.]MCT4593939.1 stage II sporulation protein D [Anaeromicrobium sp.]
MKKIIGLTIWIFIVIIIIPAILIQSCDIGENTIKKEKIIKEDIEYVYVYRTKKDKIEKIEIEEYLKGVVSSEMPASFEMEALKAQAIAARSYAVSRVKAYGGKGNPGHKGSELCDDVHCQVYRDESELRHIKPKDWMRDYYPRIKEAVEKTKGLIMTYEEKPISQPLFHSTSGGKTENSEDVFTSAVPYLRSVESPYENEAPHYTDEYVLRPSEFVSKMKKKYRDITLNSTNIKSQIKILQRSEGGRILKIKIGNKVLRGRDVRSVLGLRSANFSIRYGGGDIIFNTVGYGHGVGMSQWGANGMAKEGYKYDEILKHYYIGVDIMKMK